MELSVSAETHGLTFDELRAQENAEADAKAERARAARRVTFQGTDIALDASMTTLVDRVSEFLASKPASLDSAYRTSSLGQVTGLKRTAGGDGGRGKGGQGGGGVANRLSNEQTNAIGLVGEMVAFHWLKNRDPSGVIDESCGMSRNSRFVIEGDRQ
jgi:hypothetical protein